MNEKEVEQAELESYVYHFFFQEIYIDLSHIKDLINDTDIFLKEKLPKEEDRVEYEFDKYHQYSRVFPGILWKSVFLHQYFLIENCLNIICSNLEESNGNVIILKDFYGDGISRAKRYLKKVCGLTKIFDSQEWIKIQDFNKIRNCLVHSEGLIREDEQNLLNASKRMKNHYLQISEVRDGYFITIEKKFCEFAHELIYNFFEKVQKEMWDVKSKL